MRDRQDGDALALGVDDVSDLLVGDVIHRRRALVEDEELALPQQRATQTQELPAGKGARQPSALLSVIRWSGSPLALGERLLVGHGRVELPGLRAADLLSASVASRMPLIDQRTKFETTSDISTERRACQIWSSVATF